MDSNWYWLLILVPVWVLARILRSARFKGRRGESKVNAGITRRLDQETYRLFKNVTFPIRDETTQVDHLIVSPYGIFVIETKNMSGWIFGSADRARWTQVIYRFKQGFQNPIYQNEVHVRAVRDLLGLHPESVHNVVVFVGHSTFKTPMPPGVLQGISELANFVRSKTVPVFTQYELDRICRWIQEKRLKPSSRTDRTHVQNVKRRISDNEADSEMSCPRCGGILVERLNQGTGERFLGCKRFPRCRGSRSLS